jgi:hypothetical protein
MRISSLVVVVALLGCGDSSAPPNPERSGQKDLFAWTDRSSPFDLVPTSCSPMNCTGCCMNTSCLSGTGTGGCGKGGNPCSPCKTDELCVSGACIPTTCDDTTCKGCCDSSNACKAGTSNTVCGTSGATCKSCSSSEVCAEGTCSPKGPDMYKVTLVSAVVTGSAWIVCGFAEFSACDLYVTVKVGSATAKSTTKWNSQNPTWNEYLLTATDTALMASFHVEVDDDDDPLGSVNIGKCDPKITSAELKAGKLVVDCGDAKQLTFTLQKI